METARAVFEIGLVLVLAAAAGWLARRVGLPAVVGYLAVGVVISPFTPGYVANESQLRLLAEVGVILLLFEVGIELDVHRLRREQGALAWAAPLQTILTTALGGLVAYALGLSIVGALILGLAVALSSGVVIVNITRSRRRTTDRATEEALLGWSAMQDVTGVALASILVSLVAVDAASPAFVLVGLVVFGAIAVATARILPIVLQSLRSEHDLFLIVSIGSGLGIAGVGALLFGVPLALAAFVAGLAITEDPNTGEARRRLAPFRDVFAVMFFVTIGSLIDPAVLPAALPWLAVIVALTFAAKTLVAYVLARIARLPARPLQLAIGLTQVGEFSFVLASAGLAGRAFGGDVYAAILAAIIVTIPLSTIAVRLVPAPRRANDASADERRREGSGVAYGA